MNVNRKELLEALAPLKPALPSRTSIEALTHIWFDGEYVYAHDGGLGVRVKLQVPFRFGVSGSVFLGLLAQASADTLSLEPSDNVLAFKAGRSNVKLATLPLESRVWPYPDGTDARPVASLKATDAFLAALKQVFVVRPTNPKRMEHYAVCIFPAGKEMDLCVTDSRTLAVVPVAEAITGKVKALAIPRGFAEQLVSQCTDSPVVRMHGDYFHCAANEKVTLYSNVFDTTDILDLPKTADKFCDEKVAPPFALPEELRATLERVALMAGSEEPLVLLHTSGKKLKLTGKFKFGTLDEEFELAKALPKCTVKASTKLLLAPKDAEQMMLFKEGITLRGADGFIYALAAYGAEAAESEPTEVETEEEEEVHLVRPGLRKSKAGM